MFKIMRKRNLNFEGGKSLQLKRGTRSYGKNFRSGWAVSAARRMRLGWLLLTLLCPAFAEAQGSELWVARYHGSVDGSSDAAVAMALDSAGNVYVTGRSQGAGTGIDFATVAYDPKGNQLWVARYNGPENGDDLVNAIAVDSKTGHVYVTGQSAGTGAGSDCATVAYDFQGNQLWVARSSTCTANAIAVDSKTGSVYVAGETASGAATIAYDSSGNQLWVAIGRDQQDIHFSNTIYQISPQAIVVDNASGNVYVTGGIHFPMAGDTSAWTTAYDSTGTQLWVRESHFGEDNLADAIALGSTGNIYVTGYAFTLAGAFYTTLAYSPSGQQLWLHTYQSVPGGASEAKAIGVDSNTGNVYVTGRSATVGYDSNGNQLWVATYSGGSANAIAVDSSTGNIYVTGQSQGDYATVAYDSSGNQLWAARHSTGTANSIAVDVHTGNVIVTGQSQGSGSGTDFTTIAYSQDTTPPVTTATASPSPNGNGWNNTNVTVALNSTDNEPGGTGVKQIQYALTGAQSLDTQTVAGSTASVLITAEGITTLNYFGTDNAGNAEQSKALTLQIDKTPPVVSGMPAPGCTLWPPNGQMVQVATITAADALSGVVSGSFQVTGSSNEPSVPDNPDVAITPTGSGGYGVQLRAARLGSGTGRIYTLNATATDLAGNTVTSTVTCSVPHNVTPNPATAH